MYAGKPIIGIAGGIGSGKSFVASLFRELGCLVISSDEQVAHETVCELANMVIGNSVTLLNDQGYTFKVFPPEVHTSDEGLAGSADTEAMVLAIETTCGSKIAIESITVHWHFVRAESEARQDQSWITISYRLHTLYVPKAIPGKARCAQPGPCDRRDECSLRPRVASRS